MSSLERRPAGGSNLIGSGEFRSAAASVRGDVAHERKGEVEMRKIVAGLWVSLDGVTESPEKWSFPYFNPEVGQAVQAQMDSSDTLLLGRRTYEEFAAYWPDKSSEDDPFADFINNTPKLVVSSTVKELAWGNATLVRGDLVDEIVKAKRQPGKNLGMTGSVTLTRSLLREGLVDELGLLVCPIVIGTGKRLFDDWVGEFPLRLIDSRTFENGVVSLTYGPVAE
jgi:dihydrofolate reductase